jgi:hypothetical protein
MTKDFPYLAMDSAGERTILCDHPIKMFDNTIKPKSTKMNKTTLSSDELSRYVSLRVRNPAAADRYWARCMGQDSAIDDEAAARIKEFLKGKLSAADHETLCSMIDGEGEAPDDVEGKDRSRCWHLIFAQKSKIIQTEINEIKRLLENQRNGTRRLSASRWTQRGHQGRGPDRSR